MKLRALLPTTVLLVLSFIAPASAQTRSKRDPFDSIAAAIEKGRLAEAEKALREILKSSPDDLQALSLLGVVLDSRHIYREAEEAYLKAVKLAPNSPSPLNNLGNHYLARGDTESAYRTFQKVLTLDPTHPNANLQTTQLALDHKEYALSLRCLARLPKPEQEAVRLFPEMAEAHWLLASLYRVTGDNEKQRHELAEVQRLNKLFPPGTQTPPSMQGLLFSIRKPDAAAGQRSAVAPD